MGIAQAASAYSYSGKKWSETSTYYVFTSSIPDTWKPAIKAGAVSWNNAGAKFALYNYGSTVNQLSIQNLGPNNGAVATTTVTSSGGTISKCTLVFNNNYSFDTTGNSGTYDIQSIALHEFGHWLFLLDLYGSSSSSAAMYGYASTGTTKRSLAYDDISGIKYIYGSN